MPLPPFHCQSSEFCNCLSHWKKSPRRPIEVSLVTSTAALLVGVSERGQSHITIPPKTPPFLASTSPLAKSSENVSLQDSVWRVCLQCPSYLGGVFNCRILIKWGSSAESVIGIARMWYDSGRNKKARSCERASWCNSVPRITSPFPPFFRPPLFWKAPRAFPARPPRPIRGSRAGRRRPAAGRDG